MKNNNPVKTHNQVSFPFKDQTALPHSSSTSLSEGHFRYPFLLLEFGIGESDHNITREIGRTLGKSLRGDDSVESSVYALHQFSGVAPCDLLNPLLKGLIY